MKNFFLKLSIAAVLAVMTAIGINFNLSKDNQVKLSVSNIEALASGETTPGSCEMKTLEKTSDIIVIANAKNKWLGLVAGCKKQCDQTCTVKNPPDIKIEF